MMQENAFSIAPVVRADIECRLVRVASEDGVRLLMAVESGSRAWGFPSPDSDYDVRFIYIRPRRDYLALRPVRDVIERPIVDEIDLNGWDIRKALGLMLKHNAVLSEWIESSIRYIADDPIVAPLQELVDRFFNPGGYAKHYASLGRHNVERWGTSEGSMKVKRYFYALRPALSVRALRLDPSRRPPMQLQKLMDVCGLKTVLCADINDLIALKAITRESDAVGRSSAVERLIVEELSRADEVPERRANEQFADEAEALFLDLAEKQ